MSMRKFKYVGLDQKLRTKDQISVIFIKVNSPMGFKVGFESLWTSYIKVYIKEIVNIKQKLSII